MYFDNLEIGLQNVLLYNFEVYAKIWWIALLFIISIVYIWILRPKEQKTPFYSVSFMRGLVYIFSIINLISSPLLFLGMHPEWDGFSFILTYVILYTIFVVIYMIVLFRDVLVLGFGMLFAIGGLKLGDEKAQLAYRKLFKRSYNGKK